jgi:putative phage-type endonuclease
MRHNLIQGSEVWLNFRRLRIGASDVPIIMKESHFCTPTRLWEEKLELVPPRVVTDSMREGTRIEPIALFIYNNITGRDLKPAVLTHEFHDFMMASFDGISDLEDRAVEIKKASSKDHSLAMMGEVPRHYYGQLQQQMYVSGLKEIDYMSFVSEDVYVVVTVKRDDDYIETMVKECIEFMDCLRNFEPPEMTDKDYVERNDVEWDKAAKDWIKAKEDLERLEDEIKIYRDRLIALSQNKSSKGSGIALKRVLRKGTIKYSELEEIKALDLEKYRSKPSSYWKIDF